MSESPSFQKGDKVYRRYNPGRHGYITGRQHTRGSDTYYQVDFQDNISEYVPHYELECVDTNHSDPVYLIENHIFGKTPDLRRNFSHIQMGGKLSSLIYSLNVTNTEFYPYQFKPVLAFLESPSRGLLIADEVGLGKTIEAGLIWTELRARYDYRRILVVCPAMLREKWRDELRSRFGVEATIMDARELVSELQHPLDQVPDGRGIICSIQGIRPPRNRQRNQKQTDPRGNLARFLNEQSDNSPIIDLVIIDEAHYMRNRGSQSAQLGKMLRDVSENIILLSATPINLRNEDLFALLNIVDPDMFNDPEFFPRVLQANGPLVKARDLILKSKTNTEEILKCLQQATVTGHGFLDNNLLLKKLIRNLEESKKIASNTDRVRFADMIDRINVLRHAINRTRKVEVIERNVVREPLAKFVNLDEDGEERRFYDNVTNAVRDYAAKKEINDGFLLASPQRQVSSCMYATANSWRNRALQANKHLDEGMIYEDLGVEVGTTKELSPLIEHLISNVLPSVDLQKLRDHDSKFEDFYGVIKTSLDENPQEKIVVFSYFRATLEYLEERLTEKDIASQVLMGGMKESKQDAINRFREDNLTKVLLSSEVASEGVDLQFCRIIINYDLPWNPMKIEQRIGRLDRIGQKADKISIINLGYANTIDQRIYDKLFERLEIFKHALGGMEAILGEKIKELTYDLINHKLTPAEEEKRISQTAIAIEKTRQEEERLEQDASNLIAHSEYILNKVQTAYKLKKIITEEDLIIYVRDYLNKHSPGHEFYQPKSGKPHFYIKLSAKTAAEFAEYIRIKSLRGQTRLATGERIQCEFINKTNIKAGAVEQISQFHPLIRFINTKISKKDFFPVAAVKLSNQENNTGLQLPHGQYGFAINKWEFSGLREEDDIRIRVEHLEKDRKLDFEDSWLLLNAVRLGGSDWPEAKTEVCVTRLRDKIFSCYDYLNEKFDIEREVRDDENTDRINLQINSAELHRDRQVKSLEQVLENYRSRNETRMIPATEGRIDKIKTRFEVHIEKLKNKTDISPRNQQICCGVLLIQ